MKKTILPIIGAIILICAAYFGYMEHMKKATGSLEEFYKKNEVYLKEGPKNSGLPDYMNYEGVTVERITLEEAKNRANEFSITCGLKNVDDGKEGKDCFDSLGDDYIAYINNGTPYYMYISQECDADGACTDKEGNYDVVKFTFIKTAVSIVSKVDQYNGTEFAFELENGDVYYFTPLFDAVKVDGEEKFAHLVKINKSAKLKSFSNVDNGQITYGTEIVLEFTNNEKYVLEYDYKTNKVTLTRYDEYISKIEATEDEETEEEEETQTEPEKVFFGSSYINNRYKVTFESDEGGTDISILTIKDLKDKVLYQNSSVKTFIGKDLIENKPYVLDGKLYFISLSKDCYTASDGDKLPYLEYMAIDLDKSTIKAEVTKKTKEYIEGMVGNCESSNQLKTETHKNSDGDVITTYTYNNYKVVVTNLNNGADQTEIVIKDSNGKTLYTNNQVKSMIGKELTEKKPAISDGKLTFISLGKECYTASDGDKLPYLEYMNIDLDKSTIKAEITKKTKEYIEGMVGNCN